MLSLDNGSRAVKVIALVQLHKFMKQFLGCKLSKLNWIFEIYLYLIADVDDNHINKTFLFLQDDTSIYL